MSDVSLSVQYITAQRFTRDIIQKKPAKMKDVEKEI